MDPLLAEITARQNSYKFGPEKGDCTESLSSGPVLLWVKRIGETKLKPRQKLVLLNHYALARLNYPLTQDAYPMCILRRLDQVVRTAVRSWVKLPECSPTAMFYLNRSEGGLGFPSSARASGSTH